MYRDVVGTVVDMADGNSATKKISIAAKIVSIAPLPLLNRCGRWGTPQLYRVRGVAPAYRNDGHLGGQYADVVMKWYMERRRTLFVNYDEIFGREDYDLVEVDALNECFLLEEAELWTNWINSVYPEENTKIFPLEYPVKKIESFERPIYPLKSGSFHCFDARWYFDLQVKYWVDITECKKLDGAETAK